LIISAAIYGMSITIDQEDMPDYPESSSGASKTIYTYDGKTYDSRSEAEAAYQSDLAKYNKKEISYRPSQPDSEYVSGTTTYTYNGQTYTGKDAYDEVQAAYKKDLQVYADQEESAKKVRDTFAALFSVLALGIIFTLRAVSWNRTSALVRRFRDAGVGGLWTFLIKALPTLLWTLTAIFGWPVVSSLVAIILGGLQIEALGNIIKFIFTPEDMTLYLVFFYLALVVSVAVFVLNLVIGFARRTSEIKGKNYFAVLIGK
jgi:hypothetical protein